MHKRILSLIVLIVAVLLIAAAAPAISETAFAAPEQTTASFGVLMKPGWGGNGDAYGVTAGSVAVLHCAFRRGSYPHAARLAGFILTQTTVITTYGFVRTGEPSTGGWSLEPNCAAYTGPFLGVAPVPDGYVPPR
jgi:hypothetical protein